MKAEHNLAPPDTRVVLHEILADGQHYLLDKTTNKVSSDWVGWGSFRASVLKALHVRASQA